MNARRAFCAGLAAMLLAFSAWAANEIKATYSVSATKGYLNVSASASALSIDMAGLGVSDSVVTVPTGTSCAITISGVSTAGVAWVRNVTSNSTVFVGTSTNGFLFRCRPGECAMMTLATNLLYALAVTTTNTVPAASLRMLVLEQ